MENTENSEQEQGVEQITNNQKQIASAIIIAGLIIAGAILLKDSRQPVPLQQANVKNFADINIRPINSEDHILGDINSAKIVIVEYSDIECPFCKNFHETMHEVIKQKNNVAWVFRHYPLYKGIEGRPPLHPKALKEAEATECAWEQGGNTSFWKYIDRIFEITPSNNLLEEKELTNTAQYIGLNTASFYTCLESGKYKNKVDQDIADGEKAGVLGTPYSLILVNGKIIDEIPGAQSIENVMRRLNAIK